MLTTALLAALLAQDPETPIPFELVARKELGRRGLDGRRVIRDAKAWKAFWEPYDGDLDPSRRPPPRIDFAAEAVLAVVDRPRPSSGYAVEIVKIVRAGGEIRVHLKHTVPPRGRGQLAVETHPSFIVRAMLPADLPVRFVEDPP